MKIHIDVLLWGFIVGLLGACDGRPSRERFPGAEGRTTDIRQADSAKAVLGGVDPNQRAPVQNDEAAAPPLKTSEPSNGKAAEAPNAEGPGSEEGSSIKGVVKLGKGIKSKPGMFLFISARRPEGGPPLAVHRERDAKFPYKFSLSEADAMIPDMDFSGPVVVTARLNQAGDPMSRQAGDAVGQSASRVGEQHLTVVINEKVSP